MTLNHLLRSVALGSFFFSFAFMAHAQTVDPAAVTFFNSLYLNGPPSCSIGDAAKSQIITGMVGVTLAKSATGYTYASGYQQSSIQPSVDNAVSAYCPKPVTASSSNGNSGSPANSAAQTQAIATAATQLAAQMGKGSTSTNKTPATPAANTNTPAAATPDNKVASTSTDASKAAPAAANSATDSSTTTPPSTQNTSIPSTAQTTPDATAAAPATGTTPAAPTTTGADSTAASVQSADQVKSQISTTQPDANAAVQNLSGTPAAAPGAAVAAGTGADTLSSEALAEQQKKEAEAARLKQLDENLATQSKGSYCSGGVVKIESGMTKYSLEKSACDKSAIAADNLCPIVRSPMALKVQTFMSIGGTLLSSLTAASDACATTTNLAKIAQAGMLFAQLSCTTVKVACDTSCGLATSQKTELETAVKALQTCAGSDTEDEYAPQAMAYANKIQQQLAADTTPLTTNVAQCKKNAADIGLMTIQAAGFLKASIDAKDCQKKLAAGGTSNTVSGTGSVAITTAQFCADAANASSLTCKCTTNPNAAGCLGGGASGLSLGKIDNNGNASALAGGGGQLSGLSGSGSSGSGASSASGSAQAALAAAGSDSAFGGAAAAGGGSSASSGAGGAGVAAGADGSKAGADSAKSKFSFGFGGLSSLFGGGSSGSSAKKALTYEQKAQQEQEIKRKIASDQIRAEVSSASGKSNFDKVRSSYILNSDSFMGQ